MIQSLFNRSNTSRIVASDHILDFRWQFQFFFLNNLGIFDNIYRDIMIDKTKDILGFIDHNITVNIIEDSKIVEKKELKLPSEIKNVIRCHNPRCITSIEQGLDHVFVLTDPENEVYRCKYCEEKYNRKRG